MCLPRWGIKSTIKSHLWVSSSNASLDAGKPIKIHQTDLSSFDWEIGTNGCSKFIILETSPLLIDLSQNKESKGVLNGS